MNTTGNVVLVTGASSGIGFAIAGHLASRGFRVFGTSRHGGAMAPGVEGVAMDVDDDHSVEHAISDVLGRASHIDAVVNNAGWALAGAIEDVSIAEARALMETNFFGVLRVCHAVVPLMRAQGHGHIVNISSLGGGFGMPFAGIYSASKFAVEGLSEALRFETRKLGINVVLIQPGDTQSNLPLKRRTAAAAAAPGSAYREAFARFCAQQAKDEAKAPSPEGVAHCVENVLLDDAPAFRHTVAMIDQKMVLPLKRLLPFRLWESIVATAMGV